MKKTIYILTILFSIASVYAWGSKVGYVNVDKVLRSLPSVEKARKQLREEFASKEEEIVKHSKDFEKRLKEFQKNKATMLKSDADKEFQALLQLEQQLKQKTEAFNTELTARNEVVLQKLQTQINDTVKKIAAKEEFDLILHDRIAYVNDNSDITNKVIKAIKN